MDPETKRLSDIVSWLFCASDSQMHDVRQKEMRNTINRLLLSKFIVGFANL